MSDEHKTPTKDEPRKYWGKYRGVVLNNIDPYKMGRTLVMVPDVMGPFLSSWALPCAPMGGVQAGVYCQWPIGACCWVEFENGDVEYPIIAGAYWGSAAEVPVMSQATQSPLTSAQLSSQTLNHVTISDMPGPTGGIIIALHGIPMISISELGIIIQNGQGAMIQMIGPTVAINGVGPSAGLLVT
jgi:Type VI secretion system/phage-baseplate injector OB domain